MQNDERFWVRIGLRLAAVVVEVAAVVVVDHAVVDDVVDHDNAMPVVLPMFPSIVSVDDDPRPCRCQWCFCDGSRLALWQWCHLVCGRQMMLIMVMVIACDSYSSVSSSSPSTRVLMLLVVVVPPIPNHRENGLRMDRESHVHTIPIRVP